MLTWGAENQCWAMPQPKPGLVALQEAMAAVLPRTGSTAREGAGWSCHQATAFWAVLAQICSGMSSGRLCSAAGRGEHCQGELQGRLPSGCPGCCPASHLAASWGSTCSPADREAVSLFPLIWNSCGAPGERHCSSKPSFAPEASWRESKGLSGFLSRFPPLFSGINNT